MVKMGFHFKCNALCSLTRTHRENIYNNNDIFAVHGAHMYRLDLLLDEGLRAEGLSVLSATEWIVEAKEGGT